MTAVGREDAAERSERTAFEAKANRGELTPAEIADGRRLIEARRVERGRLRAKLAAERAPAAVRRRAARRQQEQRQRLALKADVQARIADGAAQGTFKSIRDIAAETGIPVERADRLIGELRSAGRVRFHAMGAKRTRDPRRRGGRSPRLWTA